MCHFTSYSFPAIALALVSTISSLSVNATETETIQFDLIQLKSTIQRDIDQQMLELQKANVGQQSEADLLIAEQQSSSENKVN